MGYRISALLVSTIVIAIQAADRPPCKGVPDGKYVRDPSTCQSWFLCNNEEKTHGECASIYFFDLRTGGCNYKEKVECIDNTNNTNNTNKDDLCKGVAEGTYLKNPKSCSAYFVCVSGKAIEGFCPNDHQFNPTSQTCGTGNMEKCQAYDPNDPAQYACKNVPDNTYVANDNSCKGYYFCINEKSLPYTCDGDLLFNKKTGSCDYEENVNCNIPRKDVCKGASNEDFVPDPLSCRRYYECRTKQVPKSGTCPTEYKYFHTANKICTNDIATCMLTPEQICEGEKPGSLLPDPHDCKGYYKCDVVPELKLCPGDFLFNPVNRNCDYKDIVTCDL